MERLKRQTGELTDHMKGMAGGFKGGSEAALGMAKTFGLATAGVAAMGVVVAKAAGNLGEYATKMTDLGRFSKRIGADAADVKQMVDAFARSGVDAGKARANLQGIAASMADIGRVNSQLARDLLRGQQGANRGFMQDLIDDLKSAPGDIAAFGNKIAEAAENVFTNNLAKTKNPQLAAEAKQNFLDRLGVPDITELQEMLKGATDAQKAILSQRIADAGAYNKVTTEIGQSWGVISDAVHSLALPAATAALKPVAALIKEMAEGIESAVNTLRSFEPPDWMKTLGRGVSGAATGAANVLNTVNAASASAGKATGEATGLNKVGPALLKGLGFGGKTAKGSIDAAAAMPVPAFAAGGSIGAGEMGLVGEKGPELFKPSQSGTIIPNWASTGAYGAALLAEMFGARGLSGATAGALRGHTGATRGHGIGGVLAGGIPGAPILQALKQDSESGHPLRTKLRALLGLDDPGEAAPWQVAKRAGGGPVTSGASYLVGEAGPELFAGNGAGGGGGNEGRRLVAEQTHQMQELNASNEGQTTQLKALTEELAILNRSIEAGAGGIRAQGGPGAGAGGGVRMGGLGGLPGFGGGGGGSSGGGGASGSYAPSMGADTGGGSPMAAAQTASEASQKFTGDKKAFIEKAWPMAVKAGEQTGVDPKIIMAQAALESNWGKSAPNQNYFGIKGKGGVQTTQEFEGGRMVTKRESFKGYASMEDSFQGYADFINQNKRYKPLQGAQGLNAQIGELQKSGYATDPNYGRKISQIASSLTPPSTTPSPGSSGKPAEQLGGGHYIGDGHDHSNLNGDPSLTLGAGVSSSVKQMQAQVAKTRQMAIQPELERQLDQAAKAHGLQVEVFSGGQAKIGTSNKRTGSTRHDLGNAADIKLRDPKTGKHLDMRVPEDRARMMGFTKEAVAQGATGVGAGLGYMGANALHIGGGSKASWGGADWIEDARKAGEREKLARARGGGNPPQGRAMLDADMDRSITQKVEGTGKLTVDVNAPAGTKVNAEGGGLFKTVETNRMTQMQPAADGPSAYSPSAI